ncbi:hypothetical protein SODALDRAFT_332724 [Sodiomyces alkalinus F11]|uniref:Uncharacterized protein n=1 Tax=Sodiomyces alkalinus (strain CBS 110278 / VKM F-3762 / F11) TaxID=1314773 RepID=A0A3N2PXU4_SODAK|nr:hypothetical protein SODALDRAFT_332724 [Sodiomyces alkalinus F11]ROT39288.1 hypothetical protein SODALDRAFT_332724 [Sodiomyces alkalinus F11]
MLPLDRPETARSSFDRMANVVLDPSRPYLDLLPEASQDARQESLNWNMMPGGPEDEVYVCGTRSEAQKKLAFQFLRDHKKDLPHDHRIIIGGPFRVQFGRVNVKNGWMVALPLKGGGTVEKGPVTRESPGGRSNPISWESYKPITIPEGDSLMLSTKGEILFVMVQFLER